MRPIVGRPEGPAALDGALMGRLAPLEVVPIRAYPAAPAAAAGMLARPSGGIRDDGGILPAFRGPASRPGAWFSPSKGAYSGFPALPVLLASAPPNR
jgi:hypothetical protein